MELGSSNGAVTILLFNVDGKMYVGQYENDQKHGKGVFTFTKDKVLTGFWMHGKMEGLGQL